LVATLLAGVQAGTVLSLVARAEAYREAGASIYKVTATGMIGGTKCEALGTAKGIKAAGAVRQGVPVRAANLPGRELPVWEATPGLATVLGAEPGNGSGVWLTQDVAHTLGVRDVGAVLALVDGRSLQVAGIVNYPSDGRDAGLAYSIIAPVAPVGRFDTCWAELWPDSSSAATLMLALDPAWRDENGRAIEPSGVDQLNRTLGISFDGPGEFAARPSRHLVVGGLAFGLIIGWVWVRSRRLEMADVLHAGIDKATLAWQVLFETGLSLILAGGLTCLGTWLIACQADSSIVWEASIPAWRAIIATCLGTIGGATIALALTREKHLFRYFKTR
jgi:hypothetical protein